MDKKAKHIEAPPASTDPEDIIECRRRLALAAEQAEEQGELEHGCADCGAAPGPAAVFGGGEACWKAVYKSFSDEELLDLLRSRTRRLGHVPSQKEVYWVYRLYIRARFERWPYALKKAGLSTKAGRGGMTVEKLREREQRYEELLEMVRSKARELGRPPHMFEMEEIRKELKGWFTTWAEVLEAAGIDRCWQKKEILYKVKNFSEEEKALLEQVRRLAHDLGRVPLRSEVPGEVRGRLARRCGTWRNILYQIDLEPVTKISPFGNTFLGREEDRSRRHRDELSDSLYKLVDPDDGTIRMLGEVKRIAARLGRTPVKGEIPPDICSSLMNKCSSYRNILHQIGLEPLEKGEAAQLEARISGRKKKKDPKRAEDVKL